MAHKRRDNVTYDNTTIVNSTAVASFAKLDEETLRTSGVDLIPGIGTTLSDKITAAGYKNPYDLVVKFRVGGCKLLDVSATAGLTNSDWLCYRCRNRACVGGTRARSST